MHITEIVDAADLQELDTIWAGEERVRVTDVNRIEGVGLVSVSGYNVTANEVYYHIFDGGDPVRRSCSAADAAALVDEAVAYLYAAADLARKRTRHVVQMLELLDEVTRRLKGSFRDVATAYRVNMMRAVIADSGDWDRDLLPATLETWAYDLAMEHTR